MAVRTQQAPRLLREDWRLQLARSPGFAAAVALTTGATVGGAAALGPLYATAGLIALAVGYLMLISTGAGLAAVLAIITLLPFGTLPFRAVITPNFLTLALLALMAVWIARMLTRPEQYELRLSPLGLPLLGFLAYTFFTLFLGAWGLPDPSTLHNYAKFTLALLFFFSVLNCVRSRDDARWFLRVLILSGGAAALLGLLLVTLNDETALGMLVRLGRIGYPTEGRVLRYVEDDPNGLERAIATSVDPNSFGGMLALVTALAAAQLFARRPVLPRGLLAGVCATLTIALLLTFSRAALFGLIGAVMFLATLRYRRLWWAMLTAGGLAAVLLVTLGIGEAFVERVSQGVRFADQAQQMRLAEFQNAFNIIARYPFFGIGFGQAPDLDLVAGVSSIYLAIAQRTGLVGLAAFLALVGAWFVWTLRALPTLDDERGSWLLGAQAGLVAALTVGLADHYFFNIEFSHMSALFWGCAGLGAAVIALPPAADD